MNDAKLPASADPDEGFGGSGGIIEKICEILCVAAVLVMLAVIGEDIVSRGLFKTSLELSDEIGGYMLITVAFLGLAIVKSRGAFHKTDFIVMRLPYRGQVASRIFFDLLALAVASILLWQYWRYTSTRFASGSTAPTRLGTPQWIPAVPMVLGMSAYCIAILKSVFANLRRFGAPPGDGET